MPKKCMVTGRKTSVGRQYCIRGIAKKKKGIGLNITGKSKRRFYPNLMTKKFWYAEEKRFIRLKLSAAAIRTIDKLGIGEVVRRMRKKGQKV